MFGTSSDKSSEELLDPSKELMNGSWKNAQKKISGESPEKYLEESLEDFPEEITYGEIHDGISAGNCE